MSAVYLGAYNILRCRCQKVQPLRQPAIRTSILILKGLSLARFQSTMSFSHLSRSQNPFAIKCGPSVFKIFGFTTRRLLHTSRIRLKDLIQPGKDVVKDPAKKTESKIKQLTSSSTKQEFRRLLGLAKGE